MKINSKSMKLGASFFLIALALNSCNKTTPAQKLNEFDKIIFGSCSHQDNETQMWTEIVQEESDLFIWVGDNIYGDSHDMNVMKEKYDKQKGHPEYQQLLQNVPVIGSWDDHDYGIDDGGKHFSKKDENKNLLLDFLDVPKDNQVWTHEGVYQSYEFGEAEKLVKIILLDARYFRDTLMADTTGVFRYIPNKEGDILGNEQWLWLESALKTSKAKVNIIVSGIQVIASDHRFEKWANFPKARQRFFDLLVKTKPNKTFFISGDRHIAELSKIDLNGLDYPLYDFTASGLTHTWEEPWEEENQYRVNSLIVEKNYGVININWSDTETPQVSIEVKGHQKEPYMKETLY